LATIPAANNDGLTGSLVIAGTAKAYNEIGPSIIGQMPDNLTTDMHGNGMLAVGIIRLWSDQRCTIVVCTIGRAIACNLVQSLRPLSPYAS
jgi:hypothetical protein